MSAPSPLLQPAAGAGAGPDDNNNDKAKPNSTDLALSLAVDGWKGSPLDASGVKGPMGSSPAADRVNSIAGNATANSIAMFNKDILGLEKENALSDARKNATSSKLSVFIICRFEKLTTEDQNILRSARLDRLMLYYPPYMLHFIAFECLSSQLCDSPLLFNISIKRPSPYHLLPVAPPFLITPATTPSNTPSNTPSHPASSDMNFLEIYYTVFCLQRCEPICSARSSR